MHRLSQLSSQLTHRSGYAQNLVNQSNSTPLQADHGAATNTNMAKTKVVVTRQLIDEAQGLLDEKQDNLEIVQWQSEKVSLSPIMTRI